MDSGQQTDAPPTFYADGVNFVGGVYGLQINLTCLPAMAGPGAQGRVVATVNVSPQLAKVMGRLLRKNIIAYESQIGMQIALPEKMLSDLDIADLVESPGEGEKE